MNSSGDSNFLSSSLEQQHCSSSSSHLPQQQQQQPILFLSSPTAGGTTTTSSTSFTGGAINSTPAAAAAAAVFTPLLLLPIKVTCLVKANDTSEDNVLHSDKLGLRFRHILSDASQTVASFSKSIVEENEFVKYVHAVCQDFTKNSNCDITLCYGDDKKTKVYMRYLDEPYRSSTVVTHKIMMFVRLVEKSVDGTGASASAASSMTTVLRAKDSIYKHISLGSSGSQVVQEVYIAPSSCTLYDISNPNNSDDESVILISVKNNQVQSPVEINPTRERIQEFTSSRDICSDDDEDPVVIDTVSTEMKEKQKAAEDDDDWQYDIIPPKYRHKRRKASKGRTNHENGEILQVPNSNDEGARGTNSNRAQDDTREIGLPNLVGEKVMKHFEGYGDYCGQVVSFDADSGWYTVQYEDNDEEQLSLDDVIKYATFFRSNELVPGTADMSGSFYSSLSDDTPGKIAKKVGCDIKTLLEINSMRLTKSKHGLKSTSKVWEKTIFFLPDNCDMNKLELLWGKQTVESYKSLYT